MDFKDLKDKTQREIVKLGAKYDSDLKMETKKFHELKEETQKEIAKMLIKDHYVPKNEVKPFNFQKMIHLEQFFAKQKQQFNEFMNKEHIIEEQEREFTDKKSVDFLFKQETPNIQRKNIEFAHESLDDISETEKDIKGISNILDKIKDNEQKYLRNKGINERKVLEATADLAGGYQR